MNSFMVLYWEYAKDKSRIYFNYCVTSEEPDNFEILQNYDSSMDKNSVYYFRAKIQKIVPVSFLILKDGKAKEKNNFYPK